ncbi:MAG: hypothetical protein HUU35_10235, partial [Armatimonadetes bacterium]|nr:hypothetical protein [Armatimonadota bacterium]
NRGGRLRLGSGQVHRLGEADLVVPANATGGSLTWQGLHLELPPGASLRWPARQHDPYRKDGRSPLATAKLVVVIPLPDDSPRGVTLSRRSEPPFEGIALEARDLPVTCTADSYLKRLDDLGSQFLGAKKLGEAMTFTLPAQPPGKYELLAEFVMAHSYGIVELSLAGKVIGQRFDGYTEGVDADGERVSFGTVDLAAGPQPLTVTVVGRNPAATAQLISLKRILLRPLR